MRLANVTASGWQLCSAMLSNISRAFANSPPCAQAAIIELKMAASGCIFCTDRDHQLHIVALLLQTAHAHAWGQLAQEPRPPQTQQGGVPAGDRQLMGRVGTSAFIFSKSASARSPCPAFSQAAMRAA